ncbi:hypothetical protein [Methylocystis sp.]|uniref:hypothetical protein n=1 Tax=Methylocystis sp. TaxID=1911079 RepID=UPI003D11FD5F
MLVFLIVLFAVLFIVFGVLGYGALQDGLRLLYSGISVICFIWVLILGLRLAMQGDAPVPSPPAAIDTPKIATTEPIKAEPVPPKPPMVAVPATLPKLAEKGTSFHLEPRQSSPIFRVPSGKKAHVSVFGGALTVYSGGVVKLTCDRRGFTIAGAGDGNQFVACDTAVDVVIDDVAD